MKKVNSDHEQAVNSLNSELGSLKIQIRNLEIVDGERVNLKERLRESESMIKDLNQQIDNMKLHDKELKLKDNETTKMFDQIAEYESVIKEHTEDRRLHERKGNTVIKDLKKQLQAERKRCEKLQEVLSDSKNRQSLEELFSPVDDRLKLADTSSLSSWSPSGVSSRDYIVPSTDDDVSNEQQQHQTLKFENEELIRRVEKLQRKISTLEEKVSYLESSNASMAEDLLEKTAVIDHYHMNSRAGISSSSSSSTTTSSLQQHRHNNHYHNMSTDKLSLKRVVDYVVSSSSGGGAGFRNSFSGAVQVKKSGDHLGVTNVISDVGPSVPYRDLWEAYNEFRQKGMFCDVVLVVNGRRFPVHKAILAAHSSYFFALFTNGMKESMEDVVHMQGLETESMEIILNCIYTMKLPLNKQNIYSVFAHAECFCLNSICDACVCYIVASLKPTNCVECFLFAKIHNRTDLIVKCLEARELCNLLSSNTLNSESEDEIFNVVCLWIEYDTLKRSHYVSKFLRCLRLGLLTGDFFLDKVFCSSHVDINWNSVNEIINQAWNLINWSEKNKLHSPSSRASLAHPFLKPRIPRHIIFAVGGWSGDSAIAFIETYDWKVDRWYSHPYLEDSVPRAYHAMIVHLAVIYLIGGFDGSYYFNSVKSFNPETGKWKELAPMYSQRCYVSGVCHKGLIYACGGFDGRSRLNTVECYCIQTNQWKHVQPMHHQRSDASADVFNDELYIVGGFNGEHCLSSAECYNPILDQWTLLHRMTSARSGVSLVAQGEFIYALGGFDGIRRLDSCERYNPSVNIWEPMSRMHSARSNFAAVAMSGCIYVIGGFDGSITISQVECYKISDGVWLPVSDLNMNRSALKACILDGLQNASNFTFYGQQQTDSNIESGDTSLQAGYSVFGYGSVDEMFALEEANEADTTTAASNTAVSNDRNDDNDDCCDGNDDVDVVNLGEVRCSGDNVVILDNDTLANNNNLLTFLKVQPFPIHTMGG
ncbi:hypothetical protein HELRODRAFT_194422 [Helobdella robusta]|uniref:BTB domain-containing protein n=1 Tax=Helobdella robusta TaxID=6412 RepID=T1FW14_HELRO|nr:hypothetical protein HELRODRAFT_194422 [Helobdella robusta]ESN92042.1 hypothetical protein HELRODRAFT_194422 [Helobdella robusta]